MTIKNITEDIVVYQAPNGAIELRGDDNKETIWANQSQIADIFGIDRTVISKHIKNIFKDQELNKKEVCASFAHTTQHGSMPWKTQKREVVFYNLDIILAIWYRTNSSKAIIFRQRATKTLKDHITKGFTINSTRIEKNYQLFLNAVEDVKNLSHNTILWSDDVLELIKVFASTWFSLDSFDKWTIQLSGHTNESLHLESQKLYDDLDLLKQDLLKKGEATKLFAQEKDKNSLHWILGSVFQSVFGEDAYPSVEGKSAHLLYFIVKNHPFTDGNKRSWAFAFVWFLQKVGFDYRHKITPEALTAITLLIAQSDPKDKDRIVWLVVLLLTGK